MANYVFKDKERKDKIYANECTYAEKDKYFYCKTPNCKAKMILVDCKGVKTSYFKSIPSFPHTEPICKLQDDNFETKKYIENKFNFESALNNLFESRKKVTTTNKKGEGISSPNNENVLRTIKQIYNMCINHDINDEYNCMKVWKMLVDSRSVHIYTYGIKGLRLVECRVVNYDKERNIINAICPYNMNNKYRIQLHCSEDVFKKLINGKKLNFHEGSKSMIVVAGNWEKINASTFKSKILSRAQVSVLIDKNIN